MARLWIAAGALAGLLAVGLSAWTAHGLGGDPARLRLAEAAIQQQGWHALALLATGLLAERWGGRWLAAAGACFLLGMVLFCGAVWFVALTGTSPGRIAPVGGVLLMLGWLALFGAAVARRA